MEDREIIELLFARSEEGLKELEKKYSKLYRGILRGVLEDIGDTEECENDLLVAVWNSIPPNYPEYLSAYLCRIARNIAINRYKMGRRQKRDGGINVLLDELEECLPQIDGDGYDNDAKYDAQIISDVLNLFLHELDAETRVLFIRRYIYAESVTSLAERFDMSERYIAVKMFRARKRLKKALEKEGIYDV